MPPTPRKDEIAAWLQAIGKDRHWLAEKCGTSKTTVDSWFSTRGFPKPALITIDRLIRDTGHGITADLSAVTLTVAEWEHIELARQRAGYAHRREFYRDALVEKANRIIAEEKIAEMPIAADDSRPYRTKADPA